MKLLIAEKELSNLSSKDRVPCECKNCKGIFYAKKVDVSKELKHRTGATSFCSRKCSADFRYAGDRAKKMITSTCGECGIVILKRVFDIKYSKSGKVFCSKSCAGSYNSKHVTKKKLGAHVSKFELYCQGRLPIDFPGVEFVFNDRKLLNGQELDIYIPGMKLAFELNGPTHYEPIYGMSLLHQVQKKDRGKAAQCYEMGIELAILDMCQLRHNKEALFIPYYNIISDIITRNKPRLL